MINEGGISACGFKSGEINVWILDKNINIEITQNSLKEFDPYKNKDKATSTLSIFKFLISFNCSLDKNWMKFIPYCFTSIVLFKISSNIRKYFPKILLSYNTGIARNNLSYDCNLNNIISFIIL